MSFRLFIYYCALCGGGGAFLGWALGRLPFEGPAVLVQGFKALCLGAGVALALGLVDALANLSMRRVGAVGGRVLTAVVGGAAAGLVGGITSQVLLDRFTSTFFLVVGWTLTGLLIGTALGVFDLLACLIRWKDAGGAIRKVRNGMLGGAAGGFIGGLLSVVLRESWSRFFRTTHQAENLLWSPSAWGFVALGVSIGLLIGLAQVLLKEAWLYVDQGFRKGRELLLTRPETTIGRAESCDLGLFGDAGVERLHARVLRKGGRFLLEELGTGATFVNGERIRGTHVLQSGDEIRLGRSVLRFRERTKQRAV